MFRNRFLITNMIYPNFQPNPEDEEFLESDMMKLTATMTNEDQEEWEKSEADIRKSMTDLYKKDPYGVPEDLEENIQDYIVPNNKLQKMIFKKGIRKSDNDVRKTMQDYIKRNGQKQIKEPYGGAIVWEKPRAPETQEMIRDYIKSVRSNTLDKLWYEFFQDKSIDLKTKFQEYTVGDFDLLAKQKDSLVVECTVSNAKLVQHDQSIPYLQNNQKVCIKIQPKHNYTDYQVTVEKTCLGQLWYLKGKTDNKRPHPFPTVFNYFDGFDNRAYVMVTDLFFKDLEQVIMNTKFDDEQMRWSMVKEAMLKSIDCLDVLHSYGWMHFDVKPENLMYKSEGLSEVVLMDFGCATEAWNIVKDTPTRFFEKRIEGGVSGTPLTMHINQHIDGSYEASFMYDLQAIAWSILWLMDNDKGPIKVAVEAGADLKNEKMKWHTEERMKGHNEIVRLLVQYTMQPETSREYNPEHYKKCKTILGCI